MMCSRFATTAGGSFSTSGGRSVVVPTDPWIPVGWGGWKTSRLPRAYLLVAARLDIFLLPFGPSKATLAFLSPALRGTHLHLLLARFPISGVFVPSLPPSLARVVNNPTLGLPCPHGLPRLLAVSTHQVRLAL